MVLKKSDCLFAPSQSACNFASQKPPLFEEVLRPSDLLWNLTLECSQARAVFALYIYRERM